MPIVLARVDNRLIHGQVLEAWVPRLAVEAILTVDRELATDSVRRRIFEGLKIEGVLEVYIAAPEAATALAADALRERRVLVLFAGLAQAMEARRAGLAFECLNLGNIHPRKDSWAMTPTVYLGEEDERVLWALASEGVCLDARALPTDRSPDVMARLRSKKKP